MPGLSGVGISFGADRIYDVLNALDLYPTDTMATARVMFVNFGEQEAAASLCHIKALRQAGISAELYPESAKMKKVNEIIGDSFYQYLSNLFEEIYFKDIEERYSIALPGVLRELTSDLCSSIGSLTNANKISRTLQSVKHMKVDSETISLYLNYLTESFLFSEAVRYDIKGKKYFDYPSKYYCTDIGLRNVRLGLRQQEETHIMENLIYNELIVRGCHVDVGVIPIVEKNQEGKREQKNCEIDFIAASGSKRYYIQSALNMDDPQKEKTEIRPLSAVKDSFKKIIVSKSYGKSWTDEAGILRINIIDFLLDENSLER